MENTRIVFISCYKYHGFSSHKEVFSSLVLSDAEEDQRTKLRKWMEDKKRRDMEATRQKNRQNQIQQQQQQQQQKKLVHSMKSMKETSNVAAKQNKILPANTGDSANIFASLVHMRDIMKPNL